VSVARIERNQHAIARELREELLARGRADDYRHGAAAEKAFGPIDVANAAADATARQTTQAQNQLGILALAEGGIEIDHGDFTETPEPNGQVDDIVTFEHELTSLPKLHGFATAQIDAGYDHGRTTTPPARQASFTSPALASPL
jgi:hypothetical protein